MDFIIVAGTITGLIFYNLSKDSAGFVDEQDRLTLKQGNKHANINFANYLNYLKPIRDTSGTYPELYTESKKVQARLNSYSENPAVRARGQEDMVKYNYRQRGGIGPHAKTYNRWG